MTAIVLIYVEILMPILIFVDTGANIEKSTDNKIYHEESIVPFFVTDL